VSTATPPLQSRWAIKFVAIVFGAIATLSIIGFLFNLTIKYPGTDRPVIAVDPLWMFGHIIRALALGFLAYRLWLYQSAIAQWHAPDGEGTEQFLSAHAAAWKTGAIVLGLLLLYGLIYVTPAIVAHLR
jgi:hypothetical protein